MQETSNEKVEICLCSFPLGGGLKPVESGQRLEESQIPGRCLSGPPGYVPIETGRQIWYHIMYCGHLKLACFIYTYLAKYACKI